MRRLVVASLLAGVGPVLAQEVGPERDMQEVLGRCSVLMRERAPEPADVLRAWLGLLGDDGRFTDIDYSDRSRASWEPASHLARLAGFARAFRAPGHVLHDSVEAGRAIDRGLDAWLAARPRSSNWWWNEIGVPRAMREIVVLHGDELTAERRAGAIDVIAQARQRGVGANLLWSAELTLHLGCLRGDAALVEGAASAIAREIGVTDGDGVQADMSFHQHGPRLQQLHYGGAYLTTATELAWQLTGTRWELPESKAKLLSALLLDGHQWFLRGTGTTPCGLDRAVSRRGALHDIDLTRVARLLREVAPERAAELAAFEARQRGVPDAPPLVGFRAFPRSDYAAFARPGFLFAVKGVSTRTRATEHINSENLLGFHLGFGDHYLLRRGDEYVDLMPVWDWDRLPGATIAPAVRAHGNRSAFVGGLMRKADGVFACELDLDAEGHELRGRRAWFCAGDVVVCLGAGIRSTDPAATTLDQRRLRGPVHVGFGDGSSRVLEEGTRLLRRVAWIHHDGVGYLFDEPTDVHVQNGTRTGTWRSISGRYDESEVSAEVFTAWLDHGAGGDDFVCWTVAPGIDTESVRAMSAERPLRVCARGPDVLAVTNEGNGLVQAAFFAAGAVPLDDGSRLEVDRPCLVTVSVGQLWIADPTHVGGALTVRSAGGARAATLPGDGTTIRLE